MLEFLRHLFRDKPARSPDIPSQERVHTGTDPLQPPSGATAPGTSIHYDPALIQRLLEDHRHIESLFADMVTTAQQRNAAHLQQVLDGFTTALRGHLLTENVRLYVYLQHTLGGDPENAALIQGFRQEMQQIGRVLADFLLRHREREVWDEDGWSRFAGDLAQLAPVLKKRIETEETILYPLYLPPQS